MHTQHTHSCLHPNTHLQNAHTHTHLHTHTYTHTHIVQGPDVGEIQRIKIRSSNSGLGASWHLHHVDVFSSSSPEMFHFPFDNWWVVRAIGSTMLLVGCTLKRLLSSIFLTALLISLSKVG